jgi:hypothetical protein
MLPAFMVCMPLRSVCPLSYRSLLAPPTPEGLDQYVPTCYTTKFPTPFISHPIAYDDGTDTVFRNVGY